MQCRGVEAGLNFLIVFEARSSFKVPRGSVGLVKALLTGKFSLSHLGSQTVALLSVIEQSRGK